MDANGQTTAPQRLVFEAGGLSITVLNLDADVRSAQTLRARKDAALHTHHYYEVFYVRAGAVHLITQTGFFDLLPGCVCVVAPDTLHHIESAAPLWRVMNLSFSCKLKDAREPGPAAALARLREQIGPFYIAPAAQTLPPPLERMADYAASGREERAALIGACVYEFLYLLIGSFPSVPVHTAPPIAQDTPEYRAYVIEDYINSRYHQDISLTALSALVHLSTHQLSRIIRQTHGQSFRRRVVYLRMKNAEKLIRETSLHIEQIALLVGYTSLRGFYTAFEQQYSISPGRYRMQSHP